MDLTNIDGLTDEQKEAILALHNSDVQGLKEKNEALIGEKKSAAQKAQEALDAAENARLAAKEAEKERLANEGKFEELKKIHEKEIAEATALAQQEAENAKNALNNLHKGTALNQSLALIHDNFKDLAESKLSSMIEVSYNENNQPLTAFKHNGEIVANNVDEFKSWALTQDSFKNIMNGVDSGGAGASNVNGATSSNDKDAAFKQRLKAAGLT